MPAENNEYGFVPTLSSQAGSCLTMANWEAAGIRTVAYRLDDLMMKPGQDALENLDDIRSYSAWKGQIVLNASLPPPNREGIYRFRSVYDGAWIRLDRPTLYKLVAQLKPDRVILPEGSDGYYQGDLSLADFHQLAERMPCLVESDRPAQDAVSGLVYSEGACLSILDQQMAQAHQVIEAACQCPTCSQQFTRAYLHHLLQHTPLLAQRYLVQHNCYYVQQLLSRFHLRRP